MSTLENSDLSGQKNVITNVHTNVHAEALAEPAGKAHIPAASSYEEKRPRVRHLSLLGKSWVYQRRLPRCLTKDQVSVMFRKRVGVLSVPKARIVASRIDRLVDALVFVAKERLNQTLDLNSLAEEIDEPILGFMLEKMDAAFRSGIEKLLDNGFQNPEQESAIISACLARFRADIAEFNQSTFCNYPESRFFREAIRARAFVAIGNYDIALSNAELNLRGLNGRNFEELADAVSKTSTGNDVIEAGTEAFLEAVFGSDEYAAFEKRWNTATARRRAEDIIREVLAQTQRETQGWPKGKVQQPTYARPQTVPNSEYVPNDVGETSAGQTLAENNFPAANDVKGSNLSVKDCAIVPTPLFLGRQDQKYIERPASTVRLFSDALTEYVSSREKDLGLEVGASLPPEVRAKIPNLAGKKFPTALTRGLGTLRSRAGVFMELIGDHPLDVYTKTDIEFFIHCLRFLPPKASPKTIEDAGGLRPFLETQMDRDGNDPIGPLMAAATVESGFLAGIRPIFRNNSLEDRMIDPIGLIKSDYKKLFNKSQTREYFSDAAMRDMIKEGLARKSLAFTFLPILGVITSRRLSALTGLKGSDIELAYTAYDENEKNVYAAKTNAWIDGDGKTIDPSMKTEVSKAHFILNNALEEIGFIQWAKSLNGEHIFESFQSAADHESQASKTMGIFLTMLGAKPNQVFHSFRHQGIQYLRENLGVENAVRHQAGHAQVDEHAKYGASIMPEKLARRIASIEPPRWLSDLKDELQKVDFSAFRMNDIRGATRLGKRPKRICGPK